MVTAVLIAYFVTLGALALVGVHRLWAVVWARRHRERASALPPEPPPVLVQIPLYNEAFVAERAVRAAASLRYPRSKLSIQVLDDSTDGTRAVVDRAVDDLRATGVEVRVLRRDRREGFKAGALTHGLSVASGFELVAIFDADFVPDPGFLETTVAVLDARPEVGLVQARWGHLNRDASWLTRAQAVFLDGHFGVEHAARDAAGHPFNFNGTAGLWRLRAIEEGGGWQGDTLTEDLDLSYRAQLAGWRFAYAHQVVAPAELPESWAAFRAQQARWVRGSVQTTRKLAGAVARTTRWSLSARLDALVHLTNNFAYLGMAVVATLLPGTLILREELGWDVPGGRTLLSGLDWTMLGAGTSAMIVFYLSALARVGLGGGRRLLDILFALCVGAGMSLSNTREILRGLWCGPSEFVRTPKRGAAPHPGYRARSEPLVIGLELLYAAWLAVGLAYALRWSVWGALPFLLLYLVGFGVVGVGSALEGLRGRGEDLGRRTSELSAFGTRRV